MADRKITPIAEIITDFNDKFGIPRQSGRIKTAMGKIVFEKKFSNKEAIKGLEEFSHLWLIFDFSKSHTESFSPTVRPPRLGGNKRIGVFATRSPFRPNSLGLSSVKLERIEQDGSIIVSGVDILSGTPIYDIKPYIPYTDIHNDAVGSYAQENKNHRLVIKSGEELLNVIEKDKIETVIDCLCDDPRPSYQADKNRVYNMLFGNYDIHFRICDDEISIIGVDKK